MSTRGPLLLVLALVGCKAGEHDAQFPTANRDVAAIVSDRFSTEDARDRVGEAEEVMRLANVGPGMRVADIGAGEGYYTVRLSRMVGPTGRVLAQDIVPETRDRLAERVQGEKLDNVAVRLGQPANPMLPAGSFDRIFMVHMYHEVTQPYEFLWNLRDGLRTDGRIIVVDAKRESKRHGMPVDQLKCEFAAVGLVPAEAPVDLLQGDVYFMAFRIGGPKPRPRDIKACEPGRAVPV